jgi:RelB antitoxin of RelBE toxin-antitoxin system
MEEPKKAYIVDEEHRTVAVQLDIETFNRIEEIVEDYGLARLIEKHCDEESFEPEPALAYYQSLEKAE